MHTEWQSHLFSSWKSSQYTLRQLNHKWGVKNSKFLHLLSRKTEYFPAYLLTLEGSQYVARVNNNTRMKSANNDVGRERNSESFSCLCFVRCEERSLFKVRCGCASSVHLGVRSSRESLIFAVTIALGPWEKHIHIYNFTIYSGKLRICGASVFPERWNISRSRTKIIQRGIQVT